MPESKDVSIIGAGVIGLSIGIALLDSLPNLKVKIFEKESHLGTHASGRNSGVLHAGFYYSPDSLKAKFCRDGNLELKKLCREHKIQILATGKVVVARNEAENLRLESLLERGLANGVEIELLARNKLSKIEPLAETHERFLWSPNTAVSDPAQIIKALKSNFLERGGQIQFEKEIKLRRENDDVIIPNQSSGLIVNASGAQADRLARRLGLAREFAMVPFMGVYSSIPHQKLPIRCLVYPVPHSVNPFLGVHLTLTMDKKVKIGPTAIPILGREQYGITKGWSLSDATQAIRASVSLIRGEAHDFSKIVKEELPKLWRRTLIKQATTLVPKASFVHGWSRRPPGIRSQLVNLGSGKLEQDFIVEVFGNSVHVLNAVSPGWTSCLPFGRWIVEEKIRPLLR